MRARREKLVQDFNKFVRERSAAGILNGEIVLRKQDWYGTLDDFISAQRRLVGIKDDLFSNIAFKGTVDDLWDDIEDLCRIWANKGARKRWASTLSSKSIKGEKIVIELTGNAYFTGGPQKGKKGKSLPTTNWIDLVIQSFRRGVNKKLQARLKTYQGDLVKITAEHGVRSEAGGGQGPAQQELNLPGHRMKLPGGQGNNAHTALVKALKLATDHLYISFLTQTVTDFLNYTYETTLDKRKTKNTIARDHTIRLIMIPNSEQTGKSDKEVIQATRDFFGPSGGFQELVQQFIAERLLGKGLDAIADFFSASKSYPEDLRDESIKAVLSEILGTTKKYPDMRLKVNKRMAQRIKGQVASDKGKIRTKAGNITSSVKKAAFGKTSSGRLKGGRGAQAKTSASPIALRNLLNELLPEMVAQNMGSPALNYQTGRFANSARVENVLIGPRGGINIDYTYMRNPYETFEPGGKQGSVQRDPRKLIGRSIRELSTQILGRQPTTLRRT